MRKYLWIVLLLSGLACNVSKTLLGADFHQLEVDMEVYPLADGSYYSGVVWIEEDLMLVSYALPEQRGYNAQLWTMNSQGQEMQLLDLPVSRENCYNVVYFSPHILPDGRLDATEGTGEYFLSTLLNYDPYAAAKPIALGGTWNADKLYLGSQGNPWGQYDRLSIYLDTVSGGITARAVRQCR